MNDTQEDTKKTLPNRVKKILATIGVAVIAGAAIYGIGWWQGSTGIADNKDRQKKQIESVQQQLQETKAQLAAVENYSYLMQTRAALFHTAVDLDRRNFGTANTHLQEAAVALSKVKDSSGTLNMDKLSSLQKAIAQSNINVAVNLEEQRRRVLSFVKQLDALIPEELAPKTRS
ncbi:MAG: hypothetical protein QNJ47_17635 [Nostocaceae cyanobacterium]|nr:hypothetical protein [Nostocaceae cyanobacterium]